MIQTPALLLGSCMALGKVLNLSGPGVSHWESRAGHGRASRSCCEDEWVNSSQRGGHTVSLPSRLAAILELREGRGLLRGQQTTCRWVNPVWPAPPEGAIGGISGLGEPGVWVGWELGPQDLSCQQHGRQTIPQGGASLTLGHG